MPRAKKVTGPMCIHCGQLVKPIPGATLVGGKTADYRHIPPFSCPRGDPLYASDVK